LGKLQRENKTENKRNLKMKKVNYYIFRINPEDVQLNKTGGKKT